MTCSRSDENSAVTAYNSRQQRVIGAALSADMVTSHKTAPSAKTVNCWFSACCGTGSGEKVLSSGEARQGGISPATGRATVRAGGAHIPRRAGGERTAGPSGLNPTWSASPRLRRKNLLIRARKLSAPMRPKIWSIITAAKRGSSPGIPAPDCEGFAALHRTIGGGARRSPSSDH